MLDIGWTELLVIGVVALLVVGPKELPGLLRTIGRYVGMIKRQAGEFRAQFDEAIKDTELDELKRDVESIRDDARATLRDVESAARVDESSIGSNSDHKPNYDEDELDWYDPDPKPLPAEVAAKAARENTASTNGTGDGATPSAHAVEPSSKAEGSTAGSTSTGGAAAPTETGRAAAAARADA
ncbi:MAG: Sec-independent protein translocase protein TatB [Pseudomonadota bacterium]